MSSKPKRRYTLEEYFELDRNSEIKYEYWNGEIFAMVGGSPEHSQILVNLIGELRAQLKERPCRVFPSEQRVKVPASPPYRYPDVAALCGKPEYEEIGGVKVLINPIVIVEVLSPTSERFDRGDKFTFYKSIPSFQEYILVAQHRPHITQFIKQADNKWLQSEVNDITGNLYLPTIDCTLALNEVYRDVEFSGTETLPFPIDESLS